MLFYIYFFTPFLFYPTINKPAKRLLIGRYIIDSLRTTGRLRKIGNPFHYENQNIYNELELIPLVVLVSSTEQEFFLRKEVTDVVFITFYRRMPFYRLQCIFSALS